MVQCLARRSVVRWRHAIAPFLVGLATLLSQASHDGGKKGGVYAGQGEASAQYPLPVELDDGWQTTAVLTDMANRRVTLGLAACDRDGRFLGEVPGSGELEAQIPMFQLSSKTGQ